MTTTYIFRRKEDQDEYHVTHVGKHLVTVNIRRDHMVQEFASVAAANAHVARFTAIRKRDGYAVSEVETANDVTMSLDPLAEFIFWLHEYRPRLEVSMTGIVSPRWLEKIVDRIEKEKPHTMCVDFMVNAPPDERFSKAFIDRSLPTLRSLILNKSPDLLSDQRDFHFGDIANIFGAMPGLRRAILTGNIAFRPFHHSNIAELHLEAEPMRADTIRALGKSSLPALRTLRIMLRERARVRCACPDDTFAMALSTLDAPRLGFLRVQGITDIVHFLARLLVRGLPSSLHTLRLEGAISDEDALLDVLTRHLDILRSLRRIAFPLRDEVSLGTVERVKELLPGYIDRNNVSSMHSYWTHLRW